MIAKHSSFYSHPLKSSKIVPNPLTSQFCLSVADPLKKKSDTYSTANWFRLIRYFSPLAPAEGATPELGVCWEGVGRAVFLRWDPIKNCPRMLWVGRDLEISKSRVVHHSYAKPSTKNKTIFVHFLRFEFRGGLTRRHKCIVYNIVGGCFTFFYETSQDEFCSPSFLFTMDCSGVCVVIYHDPHQMTLLIMFRALMVISEGGCRLLRAVCLFSAWISPFTWVTPGRPRIRNSHSGGGGRQGTRF